MELTALPRHAGGPVGMTGIEQSGVDRAGKTVRKRVVWGSAGVENLLTLYYKVFL